jgi:hypothetical protein
VVNLPFEEIRISENVFIRTFDPEVESDELKWHIDLEDRLIECDNHNNWMIQVDNQLPNFVDTKCYIKAGVWHRLIKGNEKLVIKITKLNSNNDI